MKRQTSFQLRGYDILHNTSQGFFTEPSAPKFSGENVPTLHLVVADSLCEVVALQLLVAEVLDRLVIQQRCTTCMSRIDLAC